MERYTLENLAEWLLSLRSKSQQEQAEAVAHKLGEAYWQGYDAGYDAGQVAIAGPDWWRDC